MAAKSSRILLNNTLPLILVWVILNLAELVIDVYQLLGSNNPYYKTYFSWINAVGYLHYLVIIGGGLWLYTTIKRLLSRTDNVDMLGFAKQHTRIWMLLGGFLLAVELLYTAVNIKYWIS